MKTKRITPEMAECLGDIHENGGIIRRHQGGFWYPGEHNCATHRSYGTSTIQGLVKRERLGYCEWQKRKREGGGAFPIAAKLANGDEESA